MPFLIASEALLNNELVVANTKLMILTLFCVPRKVFYGREVKNDFETKPNGQLKTTKINKRL
jgi:hypothetical protein